MNAAIGQRTFNFGIKVADADVAAVEALIRTHAAWMRETHATDHSKPVSILSFYVSKAPELNNPVDPSQGTTGYTVFSINETYAANENIHDHMGQASQWPQFGAFLEMLSSYGTALVVNGEVIEAL